MCRPADTGRKGRRTWRRDGQAGAQGQQYQQHRQPRQQPRGHGAVVAHFAMDGMWIGRCAGTRFAVHLMGAGPMRKVILHQPGMAARWRHCLQCATEHRRQCHQQGGRQREPQHPTLQVRNTDHISSLKMHARFAPATECRSQLWCPAKWSGTYRHLCRLRMLCQLITPTTACRRCRHPWPASAGDGLGQRFPARRRGPVGLLVAVQHAPQVALVDLRSQHMHQFQGVIAQHPLAR